MTTQKNSYKIASRINSDVNASVSYKTDLENYSTPEFWTLPNTGFGDCEDYALLKRKMLIDAGFDRDKIHLCTCFVDGAGHCVLLVETDRGNYILDNNQPEPVEPSFLSYKWDKIQRGSKWYELSF
jgi:predicted transglutaminase-like cysteine proteinase